MGKFLRHLASAGFLGVALSLLVSPSAAQAAAAQGNATLSADIAQALSRAPGSVTHWRVSIQSMTLTDSAAQTKTVSPKNTVYGSCGSSWMAIGDRGAGQAWIALGWSIRFAAWGESWSTGVSPYGSSSGGGYVAPWSSRSWDTGYSAYEGDYVGVFGAAYMVALLYPGQVGSNRCVSDPGPTAWAFIT
jgi:hypothetical protein